MSVSATRSPARAEYAAVFERVGKRSAQDELSRTLPHDAVSQLRQAGFGGVRVPVRHGGLGLTLRELFELVIDLGAQDSNTAHVFRNHFAALETIADHPEPAARERWWPRAMAGEIFSTGMTERDSTASAGSGHTATAVTERGGRLVLNGAKFYSTGSLYADWILVRAKVGWSDTPAAVLVDVHRDGVTVHDDWDGFGQRMTGSGTIEFADTPVRPDEILVRSADVGEYRQYGAAFAQLYLTAILAGITRAVLDDGVDLVRSRSRNYYHAPASAPPDDPLVQEVIGELAAAAYAAEATVLAAADALDRAKNADSASVDDLAREASIAAAYAKVTVDTLATAAAGRVFDAGGASSTSRARNLDRHWRNARTLRAHNPTPHKARVLGDVLLNGSPLPRGGFF